jgi:hypothetical protein
MSNPQIGDLEDVMFLRPAITEHKDEASGETVGLTWMPSSVTADVRDERHPDGVVRKHLPMRNQVILSMEKVEALRYAEGRPCIGCTHFDAVKGQREIQRQNLGATIVELGLQLGYNPHAIKLEDWGLCGESGGEKAASPMGTCDHWTARKRGWKHYMKGASLTAGNLLGSAAEKVASSVDAVAGYIVNDKRGEK